MKKALILLNMGGVNSLDEVELFLKNMFSDKNILPINSFLRKIIGTIIVKRRVNEVKSNFKKYMNGKSPLTEITDRLIEKIKQRLDIEVAPAMRYVPPFASPALKKFRDSGVDNLILFPMYPQYSTTTTLSSIEDIENRLKELNYSPTITVIEPYYDNYDYIAMIADNIMDSMEGKDTTEYDLILSAHGLPMKIVKQGDPYQKQIEANVSALKIYLRSKNIIFNDIRLAYQSKVGNSLWLEPTLIDTIKTQNNKKVVIYPLSFTIDNSETIFELDIEIREIANRMKYEEYIVVKCFNDSDKFVDFIIKRVRAIG